MLAMDSTTAGPQSSPNAPERRSFLARFATIVLGGLATLLPFAAGAGVLLDPLRRRQKSRGTGGELAGFVSVCPLDALPADGVPRPFVITTDLVDAWTRATNQRIGTVFLSRTDDGDSPQILAFTAACPHLGCAIEFHAAEGQYGCPCHVSGFTKDGQKLFGPSQRGLDPLEVKFVDRDGAKQIWVAFQRFQAGVAERVPIG
jgi:nitrite reductase/ring-hydroxylating ferredoxin subunit